MSTTVISIKIDRKTKTEAQKLAEELGLSLSGIIKAQLKHFIRLKRIDVSLDEVPSKYLLESLKKSDEEIKAGRVLSFEDGRDALAYLDREIENEKRTKTAR